MDIAGKAVELHRALVVDEAKALPVAAGVVYGVGVDRLPIGPEIAQHLGKVGEVLPQFDDRDQIELTEDLCDKV